jgi:predicted HicB family RNase H-like nuclease
MNNVIEVEGHKAVVAFDPEIRMFRGEFLGMNGGADFLAEDVEGLLREARLSLKAFLAMCAEKGVNPFREYSGRFNVRLDPKTHEAAAVAAAASNKSLNEWVAEAIEEAVHSS